MRSTIRMQRLAASAGVALVVVIAPSASAMAAEPDPGPNPFYFTAEELPRFDTPFGVSQSPRIPQGIGDLRSGEPSCAAPPQLSATDASSADGYTLPIRIKLTDGMMVAGYAPAAAYGKQPLPFTVAVKGMTGWVNARIQLPSMKVLVDPTDAIFCEDDRARMYAEDSVGGAPHPEFGALDDESYYLGSVLKQPDGTSFYPRPGSLSGNYRLSHPDNLPEGRFELHDIRVSSVSAAVTGVRSTGALDLKTELELSANVTTGDRDLEMPVDIAGTFSTEVKAPVTPKIQEDIPWDIGDQVPPRPSYLPTSRLPGAVEGATSTVGSNSFKIDTSRVSSLPPGPSRDLGVSLSSVLFGPDKYGAALLIDMPWGDAYLAYISEMAGGTKPFLPVAPGVADLAIDMTIDEIGLRKGVPTGFGFDG